MTPLSASLSMNFGSAGGSSGEGEAAVLGDATLTASGDWGIESLVLLRLVARSITGVGSAWNVVNASESSPS